jgi:hypothetical protein
VGLSRNREGEILRIIQEGESTPQKIGLSDNKRKLIREKINNPFRLPEVNEDIFVSVILILL